MMRALILSWVQKYRNWKFRLFITLIAVIVTQAVWHFQISPATSDYCRLQNLWLLCAYVLTFLITGLLFFSVFFKKEQEEEIKDKDKVKEALAYGVLALLLYVVTFALAISYFNSNSPWLFVIPILYAATIFFLDVQLYNANLPGLKDKKKWFPFDVAVLTGVIIVSILQWLMRDISGIDVQVVNGFGGGATAFQLIMANMVFDPGPYLE